MAERERVIDLKRETNDATGDRRLWRSTIILEGTYIEYVVFHDHFAALF